jgi:hypothetical protein
LKVLDFQTISNEHERYQTSSSMVGKTWDFISYHWIFFCQTWRIVNSHIENERISPFIEIFTNLKGSCPIKQLGIVAFCEQYLA